MIFRLYFMNIVGQQTSFWGQTSIYYW